MGKAMMEPASEQTAPTVSVLIPIYNTRAEWLRETIDSVLNQDLPDFELLLADDCSTQPEVREVLESYRDPRIRVMYNERNMGCAATTNKLFDMARGRYWMRLDADDTIPPSRLRKQVEHFETHPDIGVCACWFDHMATGEVFRIPEDDMAIRQILCISCIIPNSAAMYRASVMREHHIRFDMEFPMSDDWALLRRLLRVTKFGAVQEVLFHYRTSPHSFSRRSKVGMRRDTYILQQRIRRENPEAWNEIRDKIVTTRRYRLFGLIPFLTITKSGNETTCKLFSCITLYTTRDKFKF